MQFLLQTPVGFEKERKYIADVLLGDFLGLEFTHVVHPETKGVVLSVPAMNSQAAIELDDSFFSSAAAKWLEAASLPKLPLCIWDTDTQMVDAPLIESHIPVLYGQPLPEGRWCESDNNVTKIGLDIFGSSFFLLSRYEEVVVPIRDAHNRFPASASIAHQSDFLHRPLVNEYLEILWSVIARTWLGAARKERTFQTLVSHDVDWPLTKAGGIQTLVRSVGGDIIRKRSASTAWKRFINFFASQQADYRFDPHNTFDFLMNTSEALGLQSSFYFISGNTAGPIDGEYELTQPFISNLMSSIAQRGHEIGLHPSYNTYKDPEAITSEFAILKKATNQLGIEQLHWGGRQHYLRWTAPITWRAWEYAGLDYDSSVGYADQAGFRAGTCYEYQVFDVEYGDTLDLRERPLIVMDGTLLGRQYMNLSMPDAYKIAKELKDACRKFSGDFTFLWHNSYFDTPRHRTLYREILQG